MLGTAPSDRAFVFLEYAGAWGAKALAASRLPDEVKRFLEDLEGVAVFLIRRHHQADDAPANGGVRVFTAVANTSGFVVESTILAQVEEVLELDLAAVGRGGSAGLTPSEEPLWLVCTNGKRDRCCAEIGRPIVKTLAAEWPRGTWEVTHLGGHRFSGTLLALPSGITLGRLDDAAVVAHAQDVLLGAPSRAVLRGRAGLSGAAQVAQATIAQRTGCPLGDVRVVGESNVEIRLEASGRTFEVGVETTLGPPRRQSCGDGKEKPTMRWRVTGVAEQD